MLTWQCKLTNYLRLNLLLLNEDNISFKLSTIPIGSHYDTGRTQHIIDVLVVVETALNCCTT